MTKKVIMEASFEAIPIKGDSIGYYLENDAGYVDIGGFSVNTPGYEKEIPFDFETTSLSYGHNNSYVFGNYDGFLERIFDVDPCHEEDWAQNDLSKEDITAELLASATKLNEFYFNLSDSNDESIPCFLKVTDMLFIDENDNDFHIESNVLDSYNKQRVIEQVLDYLKSPDVAYDGMKNALIKDIKELYLEKLNSNNAADILPIIESIQKHPLYSSSESRSYCDFLIDSLINVCNSKDNVIRVGLLACGNIDHDENPFELVPGLDARYFYSDDIKKCQEAVLKYIADNDLGAGNFIGGQLYKGNEYIGGISYNGRVWDSNHEYFTIESLKKSPIYDFISEMNLNMPMFSNAINSQLGKDVQINKALDDLIHKAEKKCSISEQRKEIRKDLDK